MIVADPKSAHLHPLFARQFEHFRALAWQRHRTDVRINSGYRSSVEQARLFNLYLAGRGAPANRPGTSQHERGCAVDIMPDTKARPVLRNLLGTCGLTLPYAHEPWHLEPVWTRGQPQAEWERRFTAEETDMAAPAFQTDEAASAFITQVVRANVADLLHHHRAAMMNEIAKAITEVKISDANTDIAIEKVVYGWLRPIADKLGVQLPSFSANPPEGL